MRSVALYVSATVDGRVAWGGAAADGWIAGGVRDLWVSSAAAQRWLLRTLGARVAVPNTSIEGTLERALLVDAAQSRLVAPLDRAPAEVALAARRMAVRQGEPLMRTRVQGVPASYLHWVPPGTDPYLLAVDASTRRGCSYFSFVTGGGWYGSGTVDAGTHVAEFAAIVEGLAAYPDGSSVRVISDSSYAVRLACDLARGASGSWTRSVPTRLVQAAQTHLSRLGPVEVNWMRRNTEPLHRLADRIASRQPVPSRGGVARRVVDGPDEYARSGRLRSKLA